MSRAPYAPPLSRRRRLPPAAAGFPLAIFRIVTVLLLLFIFLVGIKGLGDGFTMLGRDLLESFFRATENPFTALVIGILATTLVQSSSVTTALVVGLVAAPENPLPLANAIPMIMGANIGTSVTNTLVSLAHVGRPQEFRRAFSVATCHDFFNYLTVLVLLPLELMTGFLRYAAESTAHMLVSRGTGGVQYDSPLKPLLEGAFSPIKGAIAGTFDLRQAQAVATILVSAALIIGALTLIVRVMRRALQDRVETGILRIFEKAGALGLVVGIILTVMVQSSTITTSVLVPIAGAGIITLEQAFPVTIGANIGTTITALLASLAASGANAEAGITIALVHLYFNITGMLMIYPFPAIRRIPLGAARWLADVATRSKRWAFAYVFGMFYGLPALFAFIERFF
jgi:solute carrier family 34 (sodium-dependent phosphate cotransporter)